MDTGDWTQQEFVSMFVPQLLICMVISWPRLAFLPVRMKPLDQKIIMPTSQQDSVSKYALKYLHYLHVTIPVHVFHNVPVTLTLIITPEDVSASVHWFLDKLMLITQPTDAYQRVQLNPITLRQIEPTNVCYCVRRLLPKCMPITRPENAFKIVLVEILILMRMSQRDFALESVQEALTCRTLQWHVIQFAKLVLPIQKLNSASQFVLRLPMDMLEQVVARLANHNAHLKLLQFMLKMEIIFAWLNACYNTIHTEIQPQEGASRYAQ